MKELLEKSNANPAINKNRQFEAINCTYEKFKQIWSEFVEVVLTESRKQKVVAFIYTSSHGIIIKRHCKTDKDKEATEPEDRIKEEASTVFTDGTIIQLEQYAKQLQKPNV